MINLSNFPTENSSHHKHDERKKLLEPSSTALFEHLNCRGMTCIAGIANLTEISPSKKLFKYILQVAATRIHIFSVFSHQSTARERQIHFIFFSRLEILRAIRSSTTTTTQASFIISRCY
jgi:hypothetical protein